LEELDQAAPANPLFLQVSYRTVYANSLVLEAVGVSPSKGAKHESEELISLKSPYCSLNAQMPDVSEAQHEQNLNEFMHTLNK